jgi:hypothetical protein
MKKENNTLNLYQIDNQSIENLIETLKSIKETQNIIKEKLEFIESKNNGAYENSIFMLKIIAQNQFLLKKI